MSKYTPGNYILVLFDRLGSKTRDIPVGGVLDGIEQGEQTKGKAECHSFSVLKVVHNSAIPVLENYDVKR